VRCGLDWSGLVNSVLNLRVPLNNGKLLRDLTTCGLLSSAQLHRGSWLVSRLLSSSIYLLHKLLKMSVRIMYRLYLNHLSCLNNLFMV
jgi:hypothetical protein